MRWIAAIGGGAFVLASLIVGVRLLWLAAQTRRAPELLLGAGLLLMGGIGYPAIGVARAAAAMPEETRALLAGLSHGLMVIGVSCMAVFNWTVFRRESARARAACAAVVSALVACWLWQGLDPGFRASALEQRGAGMVGLNALSSATMAWAAAESLRFWLMMRRRLELELAEAATVERFRDWGLATSAASAIAVVAIVVRAAGLDPATSPLAILVIGPAGIFAALMLGRAFRRSERATEAAATA